MFGMLFFRDKVAVVAAIEPMMHDGVAPKGLFRFAGSVHPVLVPEPFKETTIDDTTASGGNLRDERIHDVGSLFLAGGLFALSWPCQGANGHRRRRRRRKCVLLPGHLPQNARDSGKAYYFSGPQRRGETKGAS